MKKKANKKGFTIMEMLIVVAIIAVLVAIAIPTFNGALEKSKEAADVANVRAVYAELVVANLTEGTAYPTDLTALKGKFTGETALNDDSKLKFDGKTITYEAKKLGGENGKNYTWSLETTDIN